MTGTIKPRGWKEFFKQLLLNKREAFRRRVYFYKRKYLLKDIIFPREIRTSTLNCVNASKGNKNNIQIRYREAYPATSLKFSAPESLYARTSSYHETQRAVSLPAFFVVAIPCGRVCLAGLEMAVTTERGALLHDLSAQWRREDPFSNHILFQKTLPDLKKLDKNIFIMLAGQRSNYNYYHWLFDCLPRFHLLCKTEFITEVDLFLVPRFELAFQKESLRMLGVPAEKIIDSSDYPHVQASLLIASNHPNPWPPRISVWACRFLREAFLRKDRGLCPGKKRAKLYICRSDAPHRKVCNEEEVIRFLASRGFEILELSKLSFPEQVQKFATAEIVIGATGAGLSNIVFCERGTKVIEVFSPEYVQDIFYQVAQHAMLDYDYFICSQKGPLVCKDLHDGLRADMWMNPDILSKKLNGL